MLSIKALGYLAIAPLLVAGSINGIVKGSDGSVVESGIVSATLLPGNNRDSLRASPATVTTLVSNDGTYSVRDLQNGAYRICVTTRRTLWLDSCDWMAAGSIVVVVPEVTQNRVDILLRRGALIEIVVNDPLGRMRASEGNTSGAHLLLGVEHDDLSFDQARIVKIDSTARAYQLLVPFGRTISLTIGSMLFQVTDANNKRLPRLGAAIVLTVPQPPTVPPAPGIPLLKVPINLI